MFFNTKHTDLSKSCNKFQFIPVWNNLSDKADIAYLSPFTAIIIRSMYQKNKAYKRFSKVAHLNIVCAFLVQTLLKYFK